MKLSGLFFGDKKVVIPPHENVTSNLKALFQNAVARAKATNTSSYGDAMNGVASIATALIKMDAIEGLELKKNLQSVFDLAVTEAKKTNGSQYDASLNAVGNLAQALNALEEHEQKLAAEAKLKRPLPRKTTDTASVAP